MSENVEIIKKFVNGKFDAKILVSLTQKGNFLNPSITLMGGKEYKTKFGKSMNVQLKLDELKKMNKSISEIIEKMEKELPKKEED